MYVSMVLLLFLTEASFTNGKRKNNYSFSFNNCKDRLMQGIILISSFKRNSCHIGFYYRNNRKVKPESHPFSKKKFTNNVFKK